MKRRKGTTERKEFEQMRDGLTSMPNMCANCGATEDLHIHHIIPLSLGGTNRPTNLCKLCSRCHGLVHGIKFGQHGVSIREGRKRSRAAGKWVTGPIPYGYTTNRDGYIEELKEEADIVRLIYHWRYDCKLNLQNIVEMLYEMAIPTRSGSGKWNKSTIVQLIVQPLVFGAAYKGATFPRIVDERYKPLIDIMKGQRIGKRYISYSTKDAM